MAQPETSNAPDLSATDARQGRKGRDVFVVLVISVILAAVALIAAWIYRAPQLAASEVNNAKRPAVSQTFHAPPSQPIQSAAPPS
ncbi:MAG TPA: hypothetical protein VII42_14380 [Caulobacteraceae bacterium]|jgi:hypothetical protein